MTENWPKYKKELLALGNPNSSTGLCTLWTPKEKILKKISTDNYLIAGQCYSHQEGVNLILRHVLANKKLHRIILCGVDINGVGDTLIALKQKGINQKREILGDHESIIEKDIPIEAVERFREYVDIIDKRDEKDLELLDEFLSTLPSLKPWGEPEVYGRTSPKPPESYPSEKTGFRVRGEKIGDVWLQILDMILKFGFVKKSQYSDDQQEIINLTSIISGEDPHNLDWKEYFQFSQKELEDYLPQMLSSKIPGEVGYSYGYRLRKHFLGINQIESMIRKLRQAKHSRRAVAVTWDVQQDYDSKESPCLDLIQALYQDKLTLTAFFRSNDMFKAWPENAIALRHLQYEIAEKAGVEPGDLIIVSNSAHIYSPDWEKAKKITSENLKLIRESDPRGNILIDLEGDKIKISHLSPKGKPIGEFYAKSALEAYEIITRNKILSQLGHALDIGGELAKAEIALNNKIAYIQDKHLVFE